mmetsp:Transcript_22930/g.33983  ORF Transcript_22930/g.33983 Transcript_22930/m.33983 type:complete len:220 (-) Transcript_22930:1697-2356(-)
MVHSRGPGAAPAGFFSSSANGRVASSVLCTASKNCASSTVRCVRDGGASMLSARQLTLLFFVSGVRTPASSKSSSGMVSWSSVSHPSTVLLVGSISESVARAPFVDPPRDGGNGRVLADGSRSTTSPKSSGPRSSKVPSSLLAPQSAPTDPTKLRSDDGGRRSTTSASFISAVVTLSSLLSVSTSDSVARGASESLALGPPERMGGSGVWSTTRPYSSS